MDPHKHMSLLLRISMSDNSNGIWAKHYPACTHVLSSPLSIIFRLGTYHPQSIKSLCRFVNRGLKWVKSGLAIASGAHVKSAVFKLFAANVIRFTSSTFMRHYCMRCIILKVPQDNLRWVIIYVSVMQDVGLQSSWMQSTSRSTF